MLPIVYNYYFYRYIILFPSVGSVPYSLHLTYHKTYYFNISLSHTHSLSPYLSLSPSIFLSLSPYLSFSLSLSLSPSLFLSTYLSLSLSLPLFTLHSLSLFFFVSHCFSLLCFNISPFVSRAPRNGIYIYTSKTYLHSMYSMYTFIHIHYV